jgi:hypothetical protein
MANFNVSVTQSIEAQPANISASQVTTYTISNPLIGSSYFTLETARNAYGFYSEITLLTTQDGQILQTQDGFDIDTNLFSTSANTSGSFVLGPGLLGLIQSDYVASVIVEPGGGVLEFTPANNITNDSLYLRGVGSNEGVAFPPLPPPPPPIIWDADALAYVNVIEITESIPLSYQEQNSVNNLFIRMKGLDPNYGNYNNTEIWDRRIALYPYVGSNVRAFRYNAIAPTTSSQFDGSGNPISPGYQTFYGGGSYNRYGFKGNGVNAYANTNLNQTNGYLQSKVVTNNGFTMGVVYKDTDNVNRSDFGVYSTFFPNDATMFLTTRPAASGGPVARLLSYDSPLSGANLVDGGKGHWLIIKNDSVSIKKAYYQGNELTVGASTNRFDPPTQGWPLSYVVNAVNFNTSIINFSNNTTMLFYMFLGFTNTTIIDAWNQIVEDFCVESNKKTW